MKATLFLLVILLAACGDGKADAARKLAEQEAATVSSNMVDLQPYDMPLLIALPDLPVPEVDSLYGKPQWVEEFGHMRIQAGDHFALTITEEPGDLARLKADLERDMLRTNTILEESNEVLVYRQEFPDVELVFIHFYRVVQVGDRSFIVESASDGRFNETDIALMKDSVQPAIAI